MQWGNKTLEEIVGGALTDGSSMLDAFLKEYAKLTGKKLSSLQPSCPTCLRKYYNEYQLKQNTMENKCDYQLQLRYIGIPLKIGGAIHLSNANLTNEYAEQLISRYLDVYEKKAEEFSPALLFSKFPENWEDAHFEEASNIDVDLEPVSETEIEPVKVDEHSAVNPDEDLKLPELREKYPKIKAISKKDFLEKVKAL